jgi:hypothetical protein
LHRFNKRQFVCSVSPSWTVVWETNHTHGCLAVLPGSRGIMKTRDHTNTAPPQDGARRMAAHPITNTA